MIWVLSFCPEMLVFLNPGHRASAFLLISIPAVAPAPTSTYGALATPHKGPWGAGVLVPPLARDGKTERG